ncbi:PREDICTED: uncharacterized protein LOC109147837 [Ipomoea nil]|uniref:uncharacterized protein LOC109147837 n=1 Tax=Ipomoea nil TaxID=35883 RepID=UPI0009013B12|nr:PREDICTED: uncharacterized protein LOC109147837 [Ipomoea nil]
MLDPTDSRAVATGKEKSNQVGKKNSARKFQYHPMGNLNEDVDPPYGLQKPIHTQAMAPQNAHFGHSKFLIQGQSSDVLRDGKGLAEVHSQNWRYQRFISQVLKKVTGEMQGWLKITLAAVSSRVLVSLVIMVIQKACCRGR